MINNICCVIDEVNLLEYHLGRGNPAVFKVH